MSALVLEADSNMLENCFPFQSDSFFKACDLTSCKCISAVNTTEEKNAFVKIFLPYFILMYKLK